MNTCPHCAVDLIGPMIPENLRASHYGGATHFRREILVEIWGVYDGGLFYRCPDCEGTWHRWPEGDWRREKAASFGVPNSGTIVPKTGTEAA